MTDILITNATIVTMDGDRRVIENGAIAIAGDRIAEIGTTEDLAARHDAARPSESPRSTAGRNGRRIQQPRHSTPGTGANRHRAEST